MSKSLVERLSKKLGCTRKEAAETLAAVTDAIEDTCEEEGGVTIMNFGSFSIKRCKRDSKLNGVTYNVDKKVVRFKAGTRFNTRINS
jgi:nucleoid DNA-binding protein